MTKQYDAPPPMTIDQNKSYTATITTAKGAIKLGLAQGAPNTVNSFVFLARSGYYDGLTFHRVDRDCGPGRRPHRHRRRRPRLQVE